MKQVNLYILYKTVNKEKQQQQKDKKTPQKKSVPIAAETQK